MSSISYIFGITASIIRNIRSLALFFDYYKVMKLSINPNFEIDEKLLASKNSIYKDIFYISMCFLYIYIMDIDEIILYYTSLANLIIIIAVLNMLLFSIKKQNQMLSLRFQCGCFLHGSLLRHGYSYKPLRHLEHFVSSQDLCV